MRIHWLLPSLLPDWADSSEFSRIQVTSLSLLVLEERLRCEAGGRPEYNCGLSVNLNGFGSRLRGVRWWRTWPW